MERLHPETLYGPLAARWFPQTHDTPAHWIERLHLKLKGVGLTLALARTTWQFTALLGLPPQQRRLLHLGLLLFHLIRAQGSTRVPLLGPNSMASLIQSAQLEELLPHQVLPQDLVELFHSAALQPLLVQSDRGADALAATSPPPPFVLLGDALVDRRTLVQSLSLAQKLRLFSPTQQKPRRTPHPEDLTFPYGRKRLTLDPSQAAAMEVALNNRFSLLTGGPGTGKTSVIACLLRALQRGAPEGWSFALAAPTGKAAHRMRDAVQRALNPEHNPLDKLLVQKLHTHTLHRLLGYSPSRGSFDFDETHPLPYDFVVVDEASMMDLTLGDQLFSALGPQTGLLLSGDADQLPSVGAGNLLQDLLAYSDRSGLTVTRLTQNHRSQNAIVEGAELVRQGDAFSLVMGGVTFLSKEALQEPPEKLSWLSGQGITCLPTTDSHLLSTLLTQLYYAPNGIAETIGALTTPFALPLEQHQALKTALGPTSVYARQALLCATNELPQGTQELNLWFHSRHPLYRGSGAYLPGEPVMITKNDYEKELFNGDTGVVALGTSEGRPPTLYGVFSRNNTLRAFPLEQLRSGLTLAYAITVHKSQGSEFDTVLFIPTREFHPILTRPLLYTALTRAKTHFLFLGDEALLVQSIKHQLQRHTLLPHLLDPPPTA